MSLSLSLHFHANINEPLALCRMILENYFKLKYCTVNHDTVNVHILMLNLNKDK